MCRHLEALTIVAMRLVPIRGQDLDDDRRRAVDPTPSASVEIPEQAPSRLSEALTRRGSLHRTSLPV